MQKTEGFLSNLKLRASYGLLGNQANAALYTFASTMSSNNGLGNYIFSDGRHMYTNPPAVVNPNTTWEKVESKNIGLDLRILWQCPDGYSGYFPARYERYAWSWI